MKLERHRYITQRAHKLPHKTFPAGTLCTVSLEESGSPLLVEFDDGSSMELATRFFASGLEEPNILPYDAAIYLGM